MHILLYIFSESGSKSRVGLCDSSVSGDEPSLIPPPAPRVLLSDPGGTAKSKF